MQPSRCSERINRRYIVFLISIFLIIFACDVKQEYMGNEPITGLRITTITSDDETLPSRVYITNSEDRDVIIKEGVGGVLITLQHGTYDIKIVCREEVKWLDNMSIEETETINRKIIFPNAEILVHCEDSNNDDLSLPVYVYKSGQYDKPVNSGWSDERLDLPPGKYDIEIYCEGKSKFIKGITLKDEQLYQHQEIFKTKQ